jgi:hypothetical protein
MLKGDKKHILARLPSSFIQLSPAVISNIHTGQKRGKNTDDISDHSGRKCMPNIFDGCGAEIHG